MLKAGTLLYSIVLSIISTGIVALIILVSFYNNLAFNKSIQVHNSFMDFQNAIEYLIADSTSVFCTDESLNSNLSKFSNCQIETHWWGLYKLIILKSDVMDDGFKSCFLTGYKTDFKNRFAIRTADDNKVLSIAGNSFICGTGYIPGASIRKISIEQARPPELWQTVQFKPKNSTGPLYPFPEIIRKILPTYNSLNPHDSILKWEDFTYLDVLKNPFERKSLVLHSNNRIEIASQQLVGRIIISSSKSVIIKPSAILKDVIIVAPEVFIDDYVIGSFQCFADEKIEIGKNCILAYPSIVMLTGFANEDKSTSVRIHKETKINGDLLVLNNPLSGNNNLSLLELDSTFEINGNLYSSGSTYLHGTINGSLSANRIYAKTKMGVYEQVLYNVYISPDKLSSHYVGGLWSNNGKTDIAKFVN